MRGRGQPAVVLRDWVPWFTLLTSAVIFCTAFMYFAAEFALPVSANLALCIFMLCCVFLSLVGIAIYRRGPRLYFLLSDLVLRLLFVTLYGVVYYQDLWIFKLDVITATTFLAFGPLEWHLFNVHMLFPEKRAS